MGAWHHSRRGFRAITMESTASTGLESAAPPSEMGYQPSGPASLLHGRSGHVTAAPGTHSACSSPLLHRSRGSSHSDYSSLMRRGTSVVSPTHRRMQHAQQAIPYSVGSGGDAGERIQDGASVGPTVFNIMKDSFSVASLALPFAMQQAGPVPTLLLIVVMGVVCCHTAKLLSHTTRLCSATAQASAPLPRFVGSGSSTTLITTYAELGRAAFGVAGEAAVLIVNFVTCVGAGSAWLVGIGAALHEVGPSASYTEWVLWVSLAVLPLNYLPHVEQLGYASFVSAMAFIGLMGLIIWVGATNQVTGPAGIQTPGFAHAGAMFTERLHWSSSALLTYGCVKFVFAGHEVFLSIQESLTPKLLHPSPTSSGRDLAPPPTAAARSMEPARRPEHSTGAVMKSPSRSLLLRDLASVSGDHDTTLLHDGTSAARLADIGRQRYCQAMNGAFALMTVVNCAMATSGYLAFGALAESNVLVNLGVLRDRYPVLPVAAQVLVATTLTCTIPIVLLAAFEMTEDALAEKLGVGHRRARWASNYRNTAAAAARAAVAEADAAAAAAGRLARLPSVSELSAAGSDVASINSPTLSRAIAASHHVRDDPAVLQAGVAGVKREGYSLLGRIAVRTPIVALAVVVAVALPHLGRVVGLVGAVGDSCLGLLFPASFYLMARRANAREVALLTSDVSMASLVSDDGRLLAIRRGACHGCVEWLQHVGVNVLVCVLGVLGVAVGVAGFVWFQAPAA